MMYSQNLSPNSDRLVELFTVLGCFVAAIMIAVTIIQFRYQLIRFIRSFFSFWYRITLRPIVRRFGYAMRFSKTAAAITDAYNAELQASRDPFREYVTKVRAHIVDDLTSTAANHNGNLDPNPKAAQAYGHRAMALSEHMGGIEEHVEMLYRSGWASRYRNWCYLRQTRRYFLHLEAAQKSIAYKLRQSPPPPKSQIRNSVSNWIQRHRRN
jgi:hypothetical protein